MKHRRNLPITFCLAALFSNHVVASDQEIPLTDHYNFISFGLSKINDIPEFDVSSVNSDIAPAVSVGVGKRYFLEDDWRIDTEIALNASRTYFEGTVQNENLARNEKLTKVSGNFEEMGVWGSAKFIKSKALGDVSPYIGVGVGMVHRDINMTRITDFDQSSQLGIAYRVSSGLSYELDNNATISLEAAYTDDIGNGF